MKIVFLSNFYNHHQMALSRCLYKKLYGDYSFIATGEMDDERKKMGYQVISDVFLRRYNDDRFLCDELIDGADIVIMGSAPYPLIKKRLKDKKTVFLYSERIYKTVPPRYQMPLRALKYHYKYGRYKNIYLLCAGAFTAADYNKTKTFAGRAYEWGYFPETKQYDIDTLISQKDKSKILWVGRFLDWKHPDDAIKIAKMLKDNGCSFHIDMVGTGVMERELKETVKTLGLSDCISLIGAVPSDKVRELMEKAGIFIFTSDRREGWGAVLNEAMNSGCAVAAGHAIGAVPYLMQNGINGLVYRSEDDAELYEKVRYLLGDHESQAKFGKAAYETIVSVWNAEIAAERLIQLSKSVLSGEKTPDLFGSGPCSKAGIIGDDWLFKVQDGKMRL